MDNVENAAGGKPAGKIVVMDKGLQSTLIYAATGIAAGADFAPPRGGGVFGRAGPRPGVGWRGGVAPPLVVCGVLGPLPPSPPRPKKRPARGGGRPAPAAMPV